MLRDRQPIRHKLYVLTDPGGDDFGALVRIAGTQRRFQEVHAVATYGNESTKQTANNLGTLGGMIARLRRSNPLLPQMQYYAGADRPSTATEPFKTDPFIYGIHGKKSMEGLGTEVHTLRRSRDLYQGIPDQPNTKHTVLSLAATTELAEMLETDGVPSKISQVVIMGGTFVPEGNMGPHHEANFVHDPQATETALRICESNGIPVTLAPLDVTQREKVLFTPVRAMWLQEQLQSAGSQDIAAIIDIVLGPESTYSKFYRSKTTTSRLHLDKQKKFAGPALHDPIASAVLETPSIFNIDQGVPVLVNEEGVIATAQGYMEKPNSPFKLHQINVATWVRNPEVFWNNIAQAYSQFS